MRVSRSIKRWCVRGGIVTLTVALWLAASVPSGFGMRELFVFSAPGAVLAIAASWATHAFRRDAWRWDHAARAAMVGAQFLPPILAFAIAFLSAMNRTAIVVTFVLGAWLALGLGLAWGTLRSLADNWRAARAVSTGVRILVFPREARRFR